MNEEIITKEEREWLRNVIKPFRKQSIAIKKYTRGYMTRAGARSKSCIIINLNNGETEINFPDFPTEAMYRGMEPNRYYSLEELGL